MTYSHRVKASSLRRILPAIGLSLSVAGCIPPVQIVAPPGKSRAQLTIERDNCQQADIRGIGFKQAQADCHAKFGNKVLSEDGQEISPTAAALPISPQATPVANSTPQYSPTSPSTYNNSDAAGALNSRDKALAIGLGLIAARLILSKNRASIYECDHAIFGAVTASNFIKS